MKTPFGCSFLALLLLISGATTPVLAGECQGTKLVLLAGPRRTATTSVAEFLFKYARGARPDHKHGKIYHPLAKVRWPLVYGPVTNSTEPERPYKRYNRVVTEPEQKDYLAEVIDAIKHDYEIPEVNAVIFGGEEFDQMGNPSDNSDQQMQAFKDIIKGVGAPAECVSVVINYRVPRFEHWVSLYNSKAGTDDKDVRDLEEMDKYTPYNEHMCMDKTSSTRISELASSMNPLHLAQTYLDADPGWKVDLIDMGGVDYYGSDISHVIACDILGGKCDDDNRWVLNHADESIRNNAIERDYNALGLEEITNSEKIFRYRDCAFQKELTNDKKYKDRFQIFHGQTIWEDCNHSDKKLENIYKSLKLIKEGTRLVYDALLSQVDCTPYGDFARSPEHSIEDILSGKHLDHSKDAPAENMAQAEEDKDSPMEQAEENKYFPVDLGVSGLAVAGLVALSILCCFCVCVRRMCCRAPSMGNKRGYSGMGSNPRIEMQSRKRNTYSDSLKNMYKKKGSTARHRRHNDDSSSDDDSSASDDSFQDDFI